MGALKEKIIQVITANVPVQFFTTSGIVYWAKIQPHFSNTGSIFWGTVSSAESKLLTTGDDGDWLPQWTDVKTIFVNSAAVSNQALLLYVEEDNVVPD